MRARPGTRGGKSSFRPTDDQMWALWTGSCMHGHCSRDAEAQITLQLHWRQEPTVWAFCDGHSLPWVRGVVAMQPYYLQIEAWGTYQPTLDLPWPEAATE